MSISNIKNFYPSNNISAQKQKEVEQKVKQETTEENKKVESNRQQVDKQETVTISKEAMEKIKNHKDDTIRQDKVDELKKKIANGDYQVNANKVADKLLQQYQKTSLL